MLKFIKNPTRLSSSCCAHFLIWHYSFAVFTKWQVVLSIVLLHQDEKSINSLPNWFVWLRSYGSTLFDKINNNSSFCSACDACACARVSALAPPWVCLIYTGLRLQGGEAFTNSPIWITKGSDRGAIATKTYHDMLNNGGICWIALRRVGLQDLWCGKKSDFLVLMTTQVKQTKKKKV